MEAMLLTQMYFLNMIKLLDVIATAASNEERADHMLGVHGQIYYYKHK